MKKIIYRLREQPEEVRKNILHISIVAFAIVLFLLWIYTLGTNLTDPDTHTIIQNDLEPLSNLKADVTEGFTQLNDGSFELGQ
jgi:hypothetical protein